MVGRRWSNAEGLCKEIKVSGVGVLFFSGLGSQGCLAISGRAYCFAVFIKMFLMKWSD